jgi:hypothetical protein
MKYLSMQATELTTPYAVSVASAPKVMIIAWPMNFPDPVRPPKDAEAIAWALSNDAKPAQTKNAKAIVAEGVLGMLPLRAEMRLSAFANAAAAIG